MAWIYLALAITGGVGCWVFGRWAMRPDGRADVYGFWICLFAAAGSAIGAVAVKESFAVPQVWGAGLAFAIAYSIGFIVLIMQALKVGPAGPTTTLNNMALVCGVLLTILWLKPHVPGAAVVAGILGVAAALVLFGLAGTSSESGGGMSKHWARLVIPGSLFSGVSFMSQSYAGTLFPGSAFLYAFAGFGMSAVVLLGLIIASRANLFRRKELIAGVAVGILMSITLPVTIWAMDLIGAEVVLPVSVASPMIIVLIIGHFIYHERLSRGAITACVVGALSVALLAYGSAG